MRFDESDASTGQLSFAGGNSVRMSREDHVALIVLSAPDRANALTLEDARELLAAITQASSDADISCIVLASDGPVFCAGAHRSVLASLSDPEGPDVMREFYSVFQAIVESPIPTIAAVEGPAVGAGLNLALSCDVMVAARGARLDSRFLTLGIHPGGGNSWLLKRVLGRSQAMTVGLALDVLDGERAFTLGVSSRLVDDGSARSTALDIARGLGRSRRELVVRIKATLTTVPDQYADARASELESQLWSLGHAPAVEGPR